MIDSKISDTQGKVLPRLSISELNDRIISKMTDFDFVRSEDPISFDSECPTYRYQEYGVNISNQIYFYTKDEKLSIVTSTVMDIGYENEFQGQLSPTLEELIRSLKENETIADIIEQHIAEQITGQDSEDLEKEMRSIPIYIPLASNYKDIFTMSHAHFRGILLEAGLDEKGDFYIHEATLIDSRGSIFGRNAPSSAAKKIIANHFPETKFKKVYTGHQSVLTGDNDSCGYRVASYCIQTASGTDPKKLIDDVKCSTKTIRWIKNILPNIWNGIKKIAHKITGKAASRENLSVTEDLSKRSGSITQIEENIIDDDWLLVDENEAPKLDEENIIDDDWLFVDEDEAPKLDSDIEDDSLVSIEDITSDQDPKIELDSDFDIEEYLEENPDGLEAEMPPTTLK